MTCVVCGYHRVHAKGRCHPCYRYLRRTGTDRTEEQWVAHEYRMWVKAQERRILWERNYS